MDQILQGASRSFSTDDSLCHAYWDETPLTEQTLREFLTTTGPDDIAVMVSAKSRTPLAVRQAGFSAFAAK